MNPTSRSAPRVGPLLLPFLLVGCKAEYYVQHLEGDWAGTASTGAAEVPMTASFKWDEELAAEEDKEQNAFSGTVDIDGYVYSANGVTSAKESADIHLTPTDVRGEGDLTEVMLNEDGDAITGAFSINVCPPGTAQDPAICVLSGDFELEME